MPRVLIADRFASSRWTIIRALDIARDVQVVGEVAGARRILPQVARTRPQVVLVAVEMLNGPLPELIRAIIEQARASIVVVADAADPRQRELANQALAAGAACVVPPMPKPSSPNFMPAARALVAAVVGAVPAPASAPAIVTTAVAREEHQRHKPSIPRQARIVALASSTGGPQALQELFAALPADFPLPILAVQHIAKGYVPELVRALAVNCRMRVKLAEHQERLASRTIYIAPDDYHLGVADRHTIELSAAPLVERFRPSASWLFSSVAHRFGASAVAVILTGRGRDGVAGLAEIRRAGGMIVAQGEERSAVYGMARAAVEAGLPDWVLPLPAIAGQLMALT